MTPFITIAELTDFLGRDVNDDTVAQFVIDAACQAIRSYIGRDVNEQVDEFELLNGKGQRALVLSQWPILEVQSVTIVDESDPVPADEYYAHEAGMLIRRETVWPAGVGNIEVVYSHGWTVGGTGENAVPSDIRMVALRVAQRLYGTRGEESSEIRQETIGKYSYSTANTEESAGAVLADLEKAALDPYKKP